MNQDQERAVLTALGHSVVWRFVRRLVETIRLGAADARVVRPIRESTIETREWIQLTGYAIAAAAITNAVLLATLPAPVVGDVPFVTSLIWAVMGLVLALWPQPVGAAWSQSRLSQVFRGLFGGAPSSTRR